MRANDLGRRLRLAREARSLSQQAVADVLGLQRTAVTQMEAGNRSVSTLELAKLSELFLRPVSDFLREGAPEPDDDVMVALYRAEPGLEQDEATQKQVARCVKLCVAGVALRNRLGVERRSGPPRYEMPVPRSTGEAVVQGEQTAEQERQRIDLGNAPITDLSELISSQGIWASGVELPDTISGLFLRHPSIGLAILVNSKHVRGRKRFSYAHEYAHALMDRERSVRVSSTDNSSEMVERRANAFAAAFLMPRSGVYDALRSLDKGLPSRQEQTVLDVAGGEAVEAELRSPTGSQRIAYQDIATLAHQFGASYQAALYRLKSLRHIYHADSQALLKQSELGRKYLQALKMPGDIYKREKQRQWDRELRREVAHLAIEAYRRNEITLRDIKKLSPLAMKGDTLLRLAEAASRG